MKLRSAAIAFSFCLFGVLTSSACDRQSAKDDANNSEPSNASSEPENSEDDTELCTYIEDEFGPDGEVSVHAEEVASGLEVPWGIIFMEDDQMLVSERPGRIRLVQDGQLVEEPVAEVDVSANGEGGLLDIQAHPDFESNRQFYVYQTTDSDDGVVNRVELWQLSQDAENLSASREAIVVDDIPSAAFHNGGRLRIGPDGMLYIGTGDARERDLSQDTDSLAGKILRVTLDGEVPDDNPFGNEVFVWGLRNTQGFDWPNEDTMWVSDHGPSGEMGRSGHDEVNVAEAGTNLGWPTIYGCEDAEDLRPPALTWKTAVPPGGAVIYTGDAIEQWRGDLLVGTLGSRHLHRVVFDDDNRRVASHEVYFEGDPPEGLGRLREVIMGPDGHLYVTTSNCDGRGTCPDDGDKVYRIVPE